MPFVGYLDEASPFALHGWVHCESHPSLVSFVDIVVNRRHLTSVRAGVFRADLLARNIGDGHRSFWFNPFETLSPGENLVEVYVSGSDQLTGNGRRIIVQDLLQDRPQFAAGEQRAKHRWSNDDEEASLTSGRMMPGDSFLDQVARFFKFGPDVKVFEIGRGYGRLLKTILERGCAFRQFLGLDISRLRVEKLNAEFGDTRTSFLLGSSDMFRSETRFDLVLSSATSEHLFPSIAATLERIYEGLNYGGMVFLDFICHDTNLSISRAYFDKPPGEAFIRIYSEAELRTFFADAGFEVLNIAYPLVTGLDIGYNEVKRALVAAKKPELMD